MTAATLSPRPLSLLQPSTSTHSPPNDHLTPLRRPHPPVTSHYRPFSIHNLEVPSEPRRRSIIRSPSLSSMGFSFKDRMRDKDKEKEKEKEKEKGHAKQAYNSPKAFHTFPKRPDSPLKHATKYATGRPSTSNGFLTLPKDKGLRKKKSLTSLLSAASEDSPTTSILPSKSGSSPSYPQPPRSPLGMSDSTQLSPVDECGAKDVTIKALEEKPRPRRKPANNFVRKNTWLKRQNMKVHPYPLEATYMQAYEPLQLENDRYTDILLRRLNPLDSPSFHDYGRKIPLYALDLGCGPGHWLLEASNAWKTSQITGFDLVDTLLPEVLVQDNIQFVRGNLLQCPLPFADKTFDLVRMANLTLCIPYNKWGFVLSEIQRILTIDGRLELIDDQIFFPYGSVPTARTASAPSTTGGEPWFDDEDGDTLEDDSTGEDTDSTLFSEGCLSSPSHDKPKRISIPTPHDLAPMSPNSPLPLSPTDVGTPTSGDRIPVSSIPATARPVPWSAEVESSRDTETVFQNMLHHKFGIHTRPSDFIVDLMKQVFGDGRKLKSFHLKLAPTEVCVNQASTSNISSEASAESGSDKDEKLIRNTPKVTPQKINERAKPWFAVEWDKEEKKKPKRERMLGKLDGFRRATEPDGGPHILDVSIPEGISAKAAGRLGIGRDPPKRPSILEKIHLVPPERLGITGNKEAKVIDIRNSSPISWDEDETSTDNESTDLVVSTDSSPKAKIPSSLAGSSSTATITSTRTRRPRSPASFASTSSTTSQSPGLLLWPSTFLPLSPSELEMHACKHVHTLLGCKPALAEFIETQLDENGERLVSEEEFHRAIWDYECFRRRRFHWPSEIPEWDHGHVDESWDLVSSNRPPTPIPKFRSSTEILASPVDTSMPRPYTVDELSHVRTIRVFEAIKTDEFTVTSLQFPRPPPHIPTPPKA